MTVKGQIPQLNLGEGGFFAPLIHIKLSKYPIHIRVKMLVIVSQLDKFLTFNSIRGDKNDCTLYKITLPRSAINFRHLTSCVTIEKLAWTDKLAIILASVREYER